MHMESTQTKVNEEVSDPDLVNIAVPGERLGSLRDCIPGYGTYVSKGFVYSSLLGYIKKTSILDASKISIDIICLNHLTERHRIENSLDTYVAKSNVSSWTVDSLPSVGDYVWARVVRVGSRFVDVDILLCEPTLVDRVCISPFRGIIKAQDIRPYSPDTVNPYDCFHPGDIIRAFVVSTCDTRGGFLLSTTPAHCGVVFAQTTQGDLLQPLSHNLMRCAKTSNVELRKVSRPQDI